MNVNVSTTNIDWNFKKAERYLPVRLSQTYFDGYGECMVIVANRADGRFTDIIENEKSEYFITLLENRLYNYIKNLVLSMDYWEPNTHYNTYNGLIDLQPRKIHLDGAVF